jgi:uncharacterized protein (TIGR03086 family)
MYMRTIVDLRAPDAAAVRASVSLVNRVRPEDLARQTPCAGWDLAALLAHMTAQHHGFAASAAGAGERPAREYARAAERVLAAFAPEAVLTREFALPEFDPTVRVPAGRAIGFHLVDYVVHAWDVARVLDLPYQPEPEVVAAALPVAEAVPDGERRRAPGASFAPRLPVPAGADPMTRILALLGRSPTWPRLS